MCIREGITLWQNLVNLKCIVLIENILHGEIPSVFLLTSLVCIVIGTCWRTCECSKISWAICAYWPYEILHPCEEKGVYCIGVLASYEIASYCIIRIIFQTHKYNAFSS